MARNKEAIDGLLKNPVVNGEDDAEYLLGLSPVDREKLLHERQCKVDAVEEKRRLRSLYSNSFVVSDVPVSEMPSGPSVPLASCNFLVSRDLLEANAFKPNFSVFRGSFVRFCHSNVWTVCKIISVAEHEELYRMTTGDKLLTNVRLALDNGTAVEHAVPLTHVSSSPMTQRELDSLCRRFKLESVESLNEKHRRVLAEMRRNLTDEEITKMIGKKNSLNPQPRRGAILKIELILKRDNAIAAKDKAEAERCQRELEKLEDERSRLKRQRERDDLEDAKRKISNR